MTIPNQLTWIDGFLALLVAAPAFVLALVNYRRISRQDERSEARFRAVEARQLQSPTREDFNRIDAGVRELTVAFAAATAQLTATANGVSLLTEYLIRKSAETPLQEGGRNVDG